MLIALTKNTGVVDRNTKFKGR